VSPGTIGRLAESLVGPAQPGGSIWRDPHVQQQLLAAHLEPANPAATRTPAAVARAIELAVEGLPEGASVLDLGCGPGIYAQRLADLGFAVMGLDFNAASIGYARAHARARAHFLECDYTRDMPPGPFDLVFVVYLDFGTHLPEVQRDLLARIRTRLRPGGRLVLDFLDAPAARHHRAGRDWEVSAAGGFWSSDSHLVLTETTVDGPGMAQRIRYTLITDSDLRRFDVWEHCFPEQTMRRMLAEAGFAEVSMHRGVLEGLDPQAEDVVFVSASAGRY
jgi:SAM-dependent methyltransferase